MEQVFISKVDESFIQVEADRGILMELHENFSYTIDNAMWHPDVKNHWWDGRIKLLNLRTEKFI